jgi:hypothetical protein
LAIGSNKSSPCSAAPPGYYEAKQTSVTRSTRFGSPAKVIDQYDFVTRLTTGLQVDGTGSGKCRANLSKYSGGDEYEEARYHVA